MILIILPTKTVLKHFQLGLIVILVMLAACAGPDTTLTSATPSLVDQSETGDPVVARIDDLEISQSQLDRELAFDRAVHYLTTGRELTTQNALEKLERLTTTWLIDEQAKKAGIVVTEEEITAALETFAQERNSSIAALETALLRQGYTLEDFKASIARTIRTEKYLSQVVLAGAETPAQQKEHLVAWVTNLKDKASIEILYEPPKEAPLVGAVAPDFTLLNLNGEAVTLSQFRGQPVVVNFWATWCVPCRREMPAFQEAFEAHQDEGLVILALDLEEDAALVEPFVEEFGLTFEILYDSQGAVNKTYQVTGLPRTVFIDRQGVIQHIQVGEVQEVLLQGFLGRIL